MLRDWWRRIGGVCSGLVLALCLAEARPAFAQYPGCSYCNDCSQSGLFAHENTPDAAIWYAVWAAPHQCTPSLGSCPHDLCQIWSGGRQITPEYLASVLSAGSAEILSLAAAAPGWIHLNTARMALQIASPCSPGQVLAHIPIDPLLEVAVTRALALGWQAGNGLDTIDRILSQVSTRAEDTFLERISAAADL